MTLLSDGYVRYALLNRGLQIEGMRAGAIQPASVDLHLSDQPFKVRRDRLTAIRPWEQQDDTMADLPPGYGGDDPDEFVLEPGQFALASTAERITLPGDLAGILEGKSSLARLGLIVHTTAGFFDPGFSGYPTLELVNLNQVPFHLAVGMPIAQMAFMQMTAHADAPYGETGNSKYQQQGRAPALSRYYLNTGWRGQRDA